MAISLPPQLIAFGAALSYAISGIAARRGMRYSTPITVTLVSVTVHAVTLWAAVLLTGGVPSVSWWVLFLFALTGTLQPIIRLFTYAGIFYIGASRGTTLRSAHPLFSTGLAILFLGEQVSFPVVVGTLLIVAGITLISWQREIQRASFRWWYLGYPLGAAFLAGISYPLRRAMLWVSPTGRSILWLSLGLSRCPGWQVTSFFRPRASSRFGTGNRWVGF